MEDRMKEEYRPFVASLTYDAEMIPMTVEDAQYTLDQWAEEGSIEPPEGFTAEIFAEIWNEWCPQPEVEEDTAKKQYLLKTAFEGEKFISIKTGRQIADIYEGCQISGEFYDLFEVWDVEDEPKQVDVLDLIGPILENKRWMQQEYRDYCDAVNEYGYDFEGMDE